jgi:hypothetical protein
MSGLEKSEGYFFKEAQAAPVFKYNLKYEELKTNKTATNNSSIKTLLL